MKVAVVHNRDRAGVINVFGPQNRERYNPRTVERVAAALEKGGHTVRVIDGNMHVIEQLRDFMPRVIEGEHPGMVFNLAYGIQGVSRYTHLPAMLEMLGVPYVGSNPMAHGLALDKVIAKIVFKNAGLPTPRFWNFSSADERFDDLRFPAIVKPKMEAVSYGIRVVEKDDDLREAVAELVREFQQHVLVEEFIRGREFAIGLLGNADPEVFPIVEIDLEGDPSGIQTAHDKLQKPLGKICPAELPPAKTAELQALVKRAFNSLELYDFARVDLRMDEAGSPYILEVNSMASLGLTGTYVHAAQVAGYSYDELINRILEVAAVRYFGQEYLSQAAAAAEPAAKPEKLSVKVRSYLRSQAVPIEEILAKMVEMRTPAADVDHVNASGEWLTGQLRQLGFSVEVHPQVQTGNILYFSNHEGEEDDVLLLSHLDSVIPERSYVPFREEGKKLYGSGIAESKGGIGVALAALRALRFARALRRVKCGFLLTTDDTLDGGQGRELVQHYTGRARHVIGLKAAGPGGELVISRAGRATYRVETVYGKSANAASSAHVIGHLFRRLRALQKLSDPEAGIHVSVRRINVDAPFGRLPDRAEAVVTVRFNRPQDGAILHERILEIGKQRSSRGVRLRVSGRTRRPPMENTPENERFFAEVVKIGKRIHTAVSAAHRWHSSDLCFAPPSVPKIDAMGPIGGGERTEGEYVLRSSLVDHAALLALVIRHCRGSVGS
ncbi:MAG: M20/M25/M40 family metallo-hydrolase [Gemmatimonadota bacterium]|nr:MAG: M20/M25/M40 family metallo-hydrolase [Gemmatimonadota bacterium]